MNKAEEFRLKTQQHLNELNIAAEEFCNEMLLNFEEHEVAAGLYESSFAAEDVPSNLRPHFKGDLMKKKILLALLILSLISLSACSSSNVESSKPPLTFEWRLNPSTGKFSYGPTINGVGFGYDLF